MKIVRTTEEFAEKTHSTLLQVGEEVVYNGRRMRVTDIDPKSHLVTLED